MPGIYIHIPFCRQACYYCNFHFSTSLQLKQQMINSLVKEIELTPLHDTAGGQHIETLYFGGGTPSILDAGDIMKITEALKKKFVLSADLEFTLEANPDDITIEKLTEWQRLGINRLSLGIQSFGDEELKWMNRAHNAAQSIACIDMITAAGFTNFSADLIYGSPLLSNDDWKKNVDMLIKKQVPHISCYALTVEPKTALDKMIAMKRSAPVDAEKQAGQFLLLMNWMEDAGYEHYEISNYSKPGMRSKHNSSYWMHPANGAQISYYGFGPSAHSFDGSNRSWNISNNALYIRSLENGLVPFEQEVLSETQKLNEYIMTSLRTMEGLDLDLVHQLFGEKFSSKLKVLSTKFINSGRLVLVNSHLILTKEGKLFADGIAADLFF